MELTDSQISYFVDNRLRLPKGKRTEYLGHVDRLIEKFAAAAKGDDVIGVKKFLKTGSLRKGTVLRPKGDFGVDADVAVFLNTNGASKFFEAVIRENLDLGRPDRVRLLFPVRLTRATPPPAFGYRTRVITDGVEPSLHVEYTSSHVKQYFKEQHALRTEATINNPMDFYVRKGLDNMSHLRELGHQVNRKLLEVERVSHQCVLTQDALDRLHRPTVEDGQRVSALRFGDPRVMALFQALCAFTHLPRGFRNHDLRPAVEALLGRPYTTAQRTYDLRRLRLKGLIHRIPKTHRYTVTSYGLKVAFFYAKLYLRILRPNWAALLPDADSLPRALRTALDQLDAEIQKLHKQAALAA